MTAVEFIAYILQLITFSIFIRVILSWMVMVFGVRNNIVVSLFQAFIQITEPILGPLRRLIPPVGGMIDLTPLFALIILGTISSILLSQ